MGFLKFVIPFIGGAMTAAAAGAALKLKKEADESKKNAIEIDAEFEEKSENKDGEDFNG